MATFEQEKPAKEEPVVGVADPNLEKKAADVSEENTGDDAGAADEDDAEKGDEAEEEMTARLPPEAKKMLEKEFPILQEHGSHNAAMSGLQTDASGHRDSVHDIHSDKSNTRI